MRDLDFHPEIWHAEHLIWREKLLLPQLKALLESCGIMTYDTDSWGAYMRHLDVDEHQPVAEAVHDVVTH